MKAVSYQHDYSSDLTDEEERSKLFGELLFEEDTADSWEVESAHLYKTKDGHYVLLEANGCSCWEGDYDGWHFTQKELMKWAESKTKKQEFAWRKQAYELVADWVIQNKEKIQANAL